MSPFKRGRFYSLYVSDQQGYFQRSTGTTDARLARRMEAMCVELKDTRQWAILSALRANRVTLGQVYDAWVANGLDQLAASLTAVNLADHLTGWRAWVDGNRRAGVRTGEVYWQQVTTLVPPGGVFLASDLTRPRVTTWLASRTAASSGTRRKYLYALRSFVRYLLDVGVLETDPTQGVTTPKKNPPRKRWESAAVDQRIVDAAHAPYRALFAFIKATGADVGSALRARKGDLRLAQQRVHIRGTKTDKRDVPDARIEAWAIPYLAAHVQGIVGDQTLLWPGQTGYWPAEHHRECCRAVGVSNYTLKDARHSVGVRMRKAGASFEQIAKQLGTSVYHAVTVYAAYDEDEGHEAQ